MRYKVTVAYDGSMYIGWQTQNRNDSIEEAIEHVLKTMHGYEVAIVGSGRTDARVHAKGQVFHFDSNLDIASERMVEALNAQLDKSIRIQQVEQVDANFHARFDACAKTYEYYLSQDTKNPFIRKYMGVDYHPMDLALMQQACQIFVGTHDFTSFTSTKIHPDKDRERTIYSFKVSQEGDVFHFQVRGNSFLRYMVRMMVQTVIMVGKGKESLESVQAMLTAKSKHACKYKAEPQGLYLTEVEYEEK
ncbi:tRNA pseudouridine synthase A [Erysipelotrichaceae bacterium MTC7]|nr:tRNA pseudouridine synthase A [Erysipelotrichaceae bacterium MTC7]